VNPVVEECIRFCNNVVANSTTVATGVSGSNKSIAPTPSSAANGSRHDMSTKEQQRILATQRDKLHQEWNAKNAAINSIFEVRNQLIQVLEQYSTQKKSGVVDADNFLARRIEQKDRELNEFCTTLLGLSGTSAGASAATSSATASTSAARAEHNIAVVEQAMRAAGNAVDESELAAVIAQSTGIPVSTMLGDSEKVRMCCLLSALFYPFCGIGI
jgi:ATP-dependent Clp protease ATP-binding subunit ClpA